MATLEPEEYPKTVTLNTPSYACATPGEKDGSEHLAQRTELPARPRLYHRMQHKPTHRQSSKHMHCTGSTQLATHARLIRTSTAAADQIPHVVTAYAGGGLAAICAKAMGLLPGTPQRTAADSKASQPLLMATWATAPQTLQDRPQHCTLWPML